MRRMIVTGLLAATTLCGALGAASAFAGNVSSANGHNESRSPSGSQWV